MESTTRRLSTYPHIMLVPSLSETTHQARSLHRRQPEIQSLSDNDIHLYQRSHSLINPTNQNNTACHINTATPTPPRPIISGSSTPESKYAPDNRKGQLRYDFRFGSLSTDHQCLNSKRILGSRDGKSIFTVASARTLCSLSSSPSSPSTPTSPSSPSPLPSPPASIPEALPKLPYAITSHSTLTPMQQHTSHGLYCRFKTFLLNLLHLHFRSSSSPSSRDISIRTLCDHRFHQGRCRKCDLPESILPYLDGGLLRTGFYCREFGCEACCSEHADVGFETTLVEDGEMYRWLEESSVAPPRTQLSRSDEAPQIDPINLLPISTYQPHPLNTDSCSSSSASQVTPSSSEFSFSPSALFESIPNRHGTSSPAQNTGSTNYSLLVPPYRRPSHHTDAFIPGQRGTRFVASSSNIEDEDEGERLSPQSISSDEVIEVNVPATAVPIAQASPATIQIRNSHSRPGTAR